MSRFLLVVATLGKIRANPLCGTGCAAQANVHDTFSGKIKEYYTAFIQKLVE